MVFCVAKTEQSEPEAARAAGIAQKNYKQIERKGFAGPKREPAAGFSEAHEIFRSPTQRDAPK